MFSRDTEPTECMCVRALGKPDQVTNAGSEAGVSNLSEAADLTTYAFATIPYCLPIRRPPNASNGAHPSQCAIAPHKSRPAEAACRRRGSPALSCSVFFFSTLLFLPELSKNHTESLKHRIQTEWRKICFSQIIVP